VPPATRSAATTPKTITSTADPPPDVPWRAGFPAVRARAGAAAPPTGAAERLGVVELVVPLKPVCPLQHNR
jgi:hypothetical protein